MKSSALAVSLLCILCCCPTLFAIAITPVDELLAPTILYDDQPIELPTYALHHEDDNLVDTCASFDRLFVADRQTLKPLVAWQAGGYHIEDCQAFGLSMREADLILDTLAFYA